MLKRFLAAQLDPAAGYWQPNNRSKFVETFADVFASATRWDSKRRPSPRPTPVSVTDAQPEPTAEAKAARLGVSEKPRPTESAAMKKTHTIHGTIRTWKDDRGNEHKHRIECGAIFTSSAGRMVIKIDAIPCTKDFSGWLSTTPCLPEAPAMPPGRRLPKGFPPAPEPDTEPTAENDDKPF